MHLRRFCFTKSVQSDRHASARGRLEPNLFVLFLKRLPPIQDLIQQHAIGIYISGLGGGLPPEQLGGSPVGGLVPLPVQKQLSLFWCLQGQARLL